MFRTVNVCGAVAFGVLFMASPALAAKSPAMEYCSAQWGKMKEAKTIPEGQTWPKYWSQCGKDYAAAHATESTTGQTTTTDETTAAPEQTTTTTTTTKKPKKSTKTAVNEDEPSGSSGADKKACDGKWRDYKGSSGAHGWKAYFTFMAKCMP